MTRPSSEIMIANRRIDDGRAFIIAEAGVNHCGDLDMALRMVDAAADAGADAVKFQTFKTAKLVLPDAPKATYQMADDTDTESQSSMLAKLELSPEDHETLMARCDERNIIFLSSPFDGDSIEYLDSLDVPAFKIPSGELVNTPYLEQVAAKQKPLIISTGMASMEEVGRAMGTVREYNDAIVLLHCVSAYPADPADANLRAMETLRNEFSVPVGFSDHTPGVEVSLAAVALGACVIEKHFTLDKTLPGPDHAASLDCEELTRLVSGIRMVESALGDGKKEPVQSEKNTAEVARKSLVAVRDIAKGELFESAMTKTRRPGTGIPPWRIVEMTGMIATCDIPAGTLLSMEMFR